MDRRVPALAEQLLLIERELRALGVWAMEAPSLEALASQEPFCVDTLSFEQWLQWIFLPRMKTILEEGGHFPRFPAFWRWRKWCTRTTRRGCRASWKPWNVSIS